MSESTGLVSTAEETYNKLNLPALPESITELLVKFAPWIVLVGAVLSLLVLIPGILALFIFAPLAGAATASLSYVSPGGYATPVASMMGPMGYVSTLIHFLLSAAGAVVSLMAVSGLRSYSLRGWMLLFWAAVIYFVAGLLPFGIGPLFGAIIGAAITFYLLFQIKPYYDGRRTLPATA